MRAESALTRLRSRLFFAGDGSLLAAGLAPSPEDRPNGRLRKNRTDPKDQKLMPRNQPVSRMVIPVAIISNSTVIVPTPRLSMTKEA